MINHYDRIFHQLYFEEFFGPISLCRLFCSFLHQFVLLLHYDLIIIINSHEVVVIRSK